MLDTLLANFPKGSVVAIIGDPATYAGIPCVCPLPSDRSALRAYMRTLHAMARANETSVVVVCAAAKGHTSPSLYTIPLDIGLAADVVLCPQATGAYAVLKNRFGRSGYCVFPTTTIPEPPDLIPESAMTNDDINASSSSLPVAATPEQTARFMAGVYAWMGAGVATSAATAYLVASHPDTHEALTNGATGVCAVLAPFALIVALGYLSYKQRPYLAATAYLTLLMGVMFSSIAVKSAADATFAGDVVTALVVSAGMFAGLALAGWTTKRDLSGWGTFLLSTLWGLILAMVVNVFVGSTWLSLGISSAGVLLFSALIAYDVQTAKRSAHLGQSAAVVCALSLYLDFINLFTSILGLTRADD